MGKIISLTADFNELFALSQMEVVIHTINPDIKFIVASNNIATFSILEGSFIIQKFFKFTPKGSIHIGVVDPGVGSERRGIIIQTKNYWFVGPDNGLLYKAALSDGLLKVFQIHEDYFGPQSNTFHGRDVFAKVAAHLSLGIVPLTFAHEIDALTLVNLEWKEKQVAHIDPYGNIKLTTNLNKNNESKNIILNVANKIYSIPFCRTFADVKPGELLAYRGSHNTTEIAVNQGSAVRQLGVKVGDVLHIEMTNLD